MIDIAWCRFIFNRVVENPYFQAGPPLQRSDTPSAPMTCTQGYYSVQNLY